MTIISTSACTTFQPTCDTTDRDTYFRSARGGVRIQRTFSKIATKSNKRDMDSDVKTTPSSKKLSGHSHGSALPETPTLC